MLSPLPDDALARLARERRVEALALAVTLTLKGGAPFDVIADVEADTGVRLTHRDVSGLMARHLRRHRQGRLEDERGAAGRPVEPAADGGLKDVMAGFRSAIAAPALSPRQAAYQQAVQEALARKRKAGRERT